MTETTKIADNFYIQDTRGHLMDGTPNEGYPIRILEHYRSLCNIRCSSSSDELVENTPIIKLMNDCQRQRAEILDFAIEILKVCKRK